MMADDWADKVGDALANAYSHGSEVGQLTPAERSLIDFISIRVRHRLGRSSPRFTDEDIALLWRLAAREINAELGTGGGR